MSQPSVDVHLGIPWTDFNPANNLLDRRILCSEGNAFIAVSLLAVWITLWSFQYWKLVQPVCRRLVAFLPEGHLRFRLDEILEEARVAEDAVFEIGRDFRVVNPLNNWATASTFAICISTFGSITAAAACLSYLTLDKNALSTSKSCGLWTPDPDSSIANAPGNIMGSVSSYYESCYEVDSAQQSCDIFPERNLYVNYTDGVDCPFQQGMCFLGDKSAIGLEIGDLDSYHMHINSNSRPTVRRRTVCAPIQIQGYHNASFDPLTNSTTITFYFGPETTEESFTYQQTRSSQWEAIFSPTGYLVKTVSETLRQFLPIQKLSSTQGHTFLSFHNTFNINYPTASYDPLFPAENPNICPGTTNQTCYNNTQIPASVLGCTEFASVYIPSLNQFFDVWDPHSLPYLEALSGPGIEEAYLLISALSSSDFASILSTKHGQLLKANELITGTRLSQALASDQWKLEVRRLFDMALLRTKFELLAVVRGTRASYPDYVDTLPNHMRGVCGKVIFEARGFVNLSLVGLLCAIFIPGAVALLVGVEIRDEMLGLWMLKRVLGTVLFLTSFVVGKGGWSGDTAEAP